MGASLVLPTEGSNKSKLDSLRSKLCDEGVARLRECGYCVLRNKGSSRYRHGQSFEIFLVLEHDNDISPSILRLVVPYYFSTVVCNVVWPCVKGID